MAQLLFANLMQPFRQSPSDQQSFGVYADPRQYDYYYSVRYDEHNLRASQFLDWIVEYMTGVVVVSGTCIYFNGDANEATLILMFDGLTKTYKEPILWKYYKHPKSGSFHYWPLDSDE